MTAPYPSPRGRLALVLVAAVLLVACSGPKATPGATGSGASLPVTGVPLGEFPNVGGRCELLGEDEVRDATGFPLSDRSGLARHGVSPDPKSRLLCVFADQNGDSVIFGISPATPDAKKQYESSVELMSSPHELTGLGDAATWDGQGAGLGLEVLQDDRALSLNVILGGPELTDLLEIAKAIAAKVLDRL